MATTKRKSPPKIGEIKLTDHELEVIAANADSEFFEIITKKIIPQREVQIALTSVHASTTETELWFYKGMLHLADWFPKFITGQMKAADLAIYENDEEGEDLDARDVQPSN